ncbi:SusC/RagA family TonB-linked outer membrane protein [Pedobacter psychrodurus]|uniref:SusC/RagA family TonB-linked outer membrane protein n=1 Tax=Pedobacter psychrodurus TaxID=2530456 RepID=A0A4R0Q1A8_9SPHI|nr:SusC/RagA family TonB-linked outer membrane protein [Pedobacter psychrodurus]TCD26410.1 SusC/RagA family TonB-linked outer membrane protein [Pedobacter psychrodurus]
MRKKITIKLLGIFMCFFSIVITKVSAQEKPLNNINKKDSVIAFGDSVSSKTRIYLPFSIPLFANLSTVSTQTVDNSDLLKHPVNSVTNALTGRIAGLNTQQNSGQPGFDAVSLSLRGRTPLILIDGIPRLISTITLEEIESVTILKDAMSTALLGVRGANGALSITTKQGYNGKERISFTIQSASQRPLKMPQALNAFDYATLRNEAIRNELSVNPFYNTALLYTATDLQAFKDGSDPFGHPDVDYRNEVLKSRAPLNRYSLNMSGGNSTITYFAGVEHLKQDGLFKSTDIYDTNNYLASYLLRSNINIQINPKLSGGIHLFGRIGNTNEPGATTSAIYSSLLTTPSNSYPIFNPNGSLAGTTRFTNNIYGMAVQSGYRQTFRRDIISDFYVKRTLDDITPGLYIKGMVSFASYLIEETNRSKPVVAFQRNVSASGVETYSNALTQPSPQTNVSIISTTSGQPNVGQGRQTYLEFSAGYNRTFKDLHNVNAAVVANYDSNVYGSNIPYSIKGLSGNASYVYNEKYIGEFAASYSGSNYYPGKSHYKMGFFPVAGLGWIISKEDFLKDSKALNFLKLAANYGRVGHDNPGYFSYIQRIFGGAVAYFGTGAGTVTTLNESTLANADITYEYANKLNINLQGKFFNNQLGFSLDYYNNKFKDLLTQRGRNTSLLGNFYPNENIGRNKYNGVELQLSWQQQKASNFNYYAALNVGFQQSVVEFFDEVEQPFPWMQRTGQRVGQSFGYVADGLYQSQADIANSSQNGIATFIGYTPQPGDIKYKDLNGDGILNQFDQTVIGSKSPLAIFGANFGFSYKFFDFSALVQGVANYTINLSSNNYFEFQNGGLGNAFSQHLDRFTPATAATASYPRLSVGFNQNNHTFSSYWLRRADYIRLKNIEVGITIPSRLVSILKISSIRVFANGTNLFTATKLKGNLDPEVPVDAYPLQKLYNLGVNVKF